MSTPSPWATACARLREAVAAELTRAGHGSVRVTVHPLGVEDACGAVPPEPGDLPIHLTADAVIVGPVRSARPCAVCLARRWQKVRAPEVREAVERGTAVRAAGEPAGAGRFTEDVVAAVALARLTGARPAAGVDVVDLGGPGIRRVPLVADAGCPRCGTPEEATPEAAVPRFGPAPKPAPDAFRGRRPSQYALEPEAFANPVCGVLGPRLIRELASTTVSRAGGTFTFRGGDHVHST